MCSRCALLSRVAGWHEREKQLYNISVDVMMRTIRTGHETRGHETHLFIMEGEEESYACLAESLARVWRCGTEGAEHVSHTCLMHAEWIKSGAVWMWVWDLLRGFRYTPGKTLNLDRSLTALKCTESIYMQAAASTVHKPSALEEKICTRLFKNAATAVQS